MFVMVKLDSSETSKSDIIISNINYLGLNFSEKGLGIDPEKYMTVNIDIKYDLLRSTENIYSEENILKRKKIPLHSWFTVHLQHGHRPQTQHTTL